MSAEHPLRPLVDLGDAFNTVAPHNVINAVLSGGQSISTTPVLARQLTMYEEMNRVIPQERIYTPQPEPYVPPQPRQQATAFDALLALAPHNILAAILSGGQFPSASIPSDFNFQESIQTTGNTMWLVPGITVRLKGKGASAKVSAPKDFDLIVSYHKMQKHYVKSRDNQLAPMVLEPSSDIDYIASGTAMPTQVPIPAGTTWSIKEDRAEKYNEEKFTFQVITKRTESTIYATNVTLVSAVPKAPTQPGAPGAPKVPGAPAPETFLIEGRKLTFEQALARAQNLEAIGDFDGAAAIYNKIGRPDLASAAMARMPAAPSAPSGVPAAPTAETFTIDGVKYTYDQALQRAQFLEMAGKYGDAAKLYDAIGERGAASSARSKIQAAAETGPVANFYFRGKYYTRADLMSLAASKATSDPSTAIEIYDTLGETGKANAIRDKLASVQASAQQAQQNVMELLAQARMLEAQGNYRGAAELYTKAGYPNLADSALKKASSADQKASAKAKAQEIARQIAAAKLAAAKKKKQG